ncbi:hypothetical protein PoB_002389900 [Plakobranchus ocellatus]|uniref:Uncharacterized protein n=1 Tax=Plakobranchus ocellatus TaxID=259542 RepID=A0AAV3ZPZ5_9GAST|nr:hypothetical protein PoB_002389900 [Plakobranchus ocellatus]
MNLYSINANFKKVMKSVCVKVTSAAFNNNTRKWFLATIRVHQRCSQPLSSFWRKSCLMLSNNMKKKQGLEKQITRNLGIADSIKGIAGNEQKLFNFVNYQDKASSDHDMEVCSEKKKS